MEKPHSIPIKTHKPKKKGRRTLHGMEEFGYFHFFFQYTSLTIRLITLVYSLWWIVHCCKQTSICIFIEFENSEIAVLQVWSVQPVCFTGYEIHTNGLMSKKLINSFDRSYHWLLWEIGERAAWTQNNWSMALSKHISFPSSMHGGMKSCT